MAQYADWESETRDFVAFMDGVGREINEIAHDFNAGRGTAAQLRYAIERLGAVCERIQTLRKLGYPHAE